MTQVKLSPSLLSPSLLPPPSPESKVRWWLLLLLHIFSFCSLTVIQWGRLTHHRPAGPGQSVKGWQARSAGTEKVQVRCCCNSQAQLRWQRRQARPAKLEQHKVFSFISVWPATSLQKTENLSCGKIFCQLIWPAPPLSCFLVLIST